jgi:phospholipase C
MSDRTTRRQLLRTAGAAGVAAGLTGLNLEPWVQSALAAPRKPGALKDIEHVVIFMQENRSFDHYFGTYKGVRGFSDPKGAAAFKQAGYPPSPDGTLVPFRVDGSTPAGDCTPDITHDWGPQHRSWNGGAMDGWVKEHMATDGPDIGPLTMGYYDGADVELYHALADAFTLCDRYHCSVIGPTDPNRLYSMTGTIDPAGLHGGPLVQTHVSGRAELAGAFTWPTMPEALSAKGISWKVYTSPKGGQFDNVLPYFHNFKVTPALAARGVDPTYPDDFLSDIAKRKLPQVSWVLPSIQETEHPQFGGPRSGAFAAREIITALTKDKKTWGKTALFLCWDENGGFFDHVAPPVAPAGTPGEYLTANPLPEAAQGVTGPIGLGFRVPMLVISPFSRGGFVSSDVFDHTSTLRFLETRFGVRVPNLSAWRRKTTGDLTSAFNFVAPNAKVPTLPKPRIDKTTAEQGDCPPELTPYPVPPHEMPKQAAGKPRRPHGLKGARRVKH